MHPRTYLIVALGLAAALIGGIIAVNVRADPYGLAAPAGANGPREGAEDKRPGAFWRKAFAVRDVKPRTVILGTSRAETGIDPRYPGFASGDSPVLDLSLGASSIEQIRLLLVHANATSPVRMAVIGLDMESFLDGGRPDLDPAALRGNPESEPEGLVRLRLDVSREALWSSVARWIDPAADLPVSADRGAPVAPQARGIPDAMLQDFDGQRGIIWAAEFNNFYARLPYLFPSGPPGVRWNADKRRAAAMTSFRGLLDYARREGIELRMFISPVHARYLEWYQRVGWWPLFEAWKRGLVDAIEAESTAAPGRLAFALWDFSGFHTLAAEPVPRVGDLSTRMRWYRDTSHYSPELGNLILDRVLGRPVPDGSTLPDARISRATIDRHLAGIRMGAVEYRLSQPGEVANVSEMLTYLRRVARK
jgi:hypothetical protein